jgi:hypothetical protein
MSWFGPKSVAVSLHSSVHEKKRKIEEETEERSEDELTLEI